MLTRLFQVAVLACLFTACGGGGGGNGVPPPSTSPGGSFTLSTGTVSFNARTDDSSSLHSSVALHVNDTRDVAQIGAAYVAPNQPADWLQVTIDGSGSEYAVGFTASWAGQAPGTYTAVVSIGTANANNKILQRRDVTVTMIVTDITVRAARGPFAFSATFGHNDTARPFVVHVDAPAGRTWTVTSTAPWLRVPSTIYSGGADVPVVADAGGLAAANHTADLQFTSRTNGTDNTVRPVTLDVLAPVLSVSSTQVTLGGADGNATRQATVLVSLGTGSNLYPVTFSAQTLTGGNWLAAGSPAATIGVYDVPLLLTADAATGTPGSYGGSVRISANVLGMNIQRVVDVRFNQDQDRLVAATLGASFSKFPTRSVLRRSVRISDALGRADIPWTATDDASWLTVTASGTTGGDALLVADPTGLAADQVYYGTVTVASSSPLVDNDQRIRVALKVGSADPAVSVSFAQTVVGIVANPVEPWVYTSLVGGAIEVRDVHTGALVDTFHVAGRTEGDGLAISDDGRTLFAVDGWVTQRALALDARTGAVLGVYPLSRQYTTTLHYARPNAHPILLSGGGQVFDLETGAEVEDQIGLDVYYPTNAFAHTSDQRFLFSQLRGISPPRLEKARIAWSTLVPTHLVVEHLLWSESNEAGQGVCVSPDDSRVMTASHSFTMPFSLLNASDLGVAKRLPAQTYAASNVACLWNGLYMGTTSRDSPNLFFYDAQGNAIASSLLYQADHEPAADRVIVSGDASRVIAVTGGPSFHTSFYDAPLLP